MEEKVRIYGLEAAIKIVKEIGSGSTASRPSLYHEANGEAVHLEMNPTEELIKMG
jgi:hypothetical protein